MPLFLVEQAVQMGADRDWLLRQAGVSEGELSDPDARIQVRKALALWKAALEALPDADLGIRLSERFRIRDAGLVGFTMLHSATLGDALKRLLRFGHILDESFPADLVVSGDQVEYAVEPLPQEIGWLSRVADFDMGAVLSVVRELTGVRLEPVEVHLCYPKPDRDLSALREFFRAPIRFDRRTLRLVFSRKSLSLPVAGAEVEMGRYLEQRAEEVLRVLAPEGSLSEKVEHALWMGMKDGSSALADVASRLAMSPRTLQRRLREESTSFEDLRNLFRREMALTLLREPNLAIHEIAFLLGYAEPSSFYRAFHRWTDSTPQQFRAAKEWA